MSGPVDLTAFFARVVRERGRVLAPAIWVVLVFYIAAAPLLGLRVTEAVYAFALAIIAGLTLLTVAFMARRVPERWSHLASTAMLWCPIAVTMAVMYTSDANLVVLLVLEVAATGFLLDTRWVIATLAVTDGFALPFLLTAGGPSVLLFASMLITASMFALLIHVLMRRALVEAESHRIAERAAAHQLETQLEQLELTQAHRAQLHEQLLHSQRMEAVGTLAAGLAHDMNNVLASITSFADLTLDQIADPTTRADVEQIVAQASRGSSLTRGLLAFSRRDQYRKQVVRIADVIREVIPLLARTLPKSIEIHHEVTDGDACVDGDSMHFGQMLINLGLNAADAMDGTGKLAIITDVVDLTAHPTLPAGRYTRVRVTDTGKGMDAATRLRVFEPFFTTKPLGRGTGLGLSTVWGIVQAHDGAIEVVSEPGQGATFTIHLPVTDAVPKQIARMPGSGRIRAATVMVVDDDRPVRESTRRLLERMGLHVRTACHGAEALELFDESAGAIELVILDMGMPVMGGAECFRRLRAKSGVPVLIATGYAVEQEAQALVAAGAAIIEKPFSSVTLQREVARLLGQPPTPPT